MIDIQGIKEFFPPSIRDNTEYQKLMLKEYIQCQILEHLSNTTFITKLSFIGGTNLRLIKHIDRFSEDLDFDCKNMSREEFLSMTDGVLRYLTNLGYTVEPKEREHDALTAFRRSIYFPQLLFSLDLSGYKNARFLIKVEMQDQGVLYKTVPAFVQSCGFYFPVPVPPNDVLCSMKLSALLNRSKGRDFYDVMFLLAQTKPNYTILAIKHGIHNEKELKDAISLRLGEIDLSSKQMDLKHLLFTSQKSEMILHFASFVKSLDLSPEKP
ncbi:MAG: nucleotidyl transferase AbiEii/AbiGii toxin family protein [Sphaerochaeta sp.]|nr:nucleotidyl transferase AbiEii/AbiGii toxin family protein [Sphaerochaeta sp.]